MRVSFLLILTLIFLPAVVGAAQFSPSRDKIVKDTLDSLEQEKQISLRRQRYNLAYPVYAAPSSDIVKTRENGRYREIKKNNSDLLEERNKGFFWPLSKNSYFIFGAEIGCLKGTTTYDYNYHTSELEFPMDNWMGGGNLTLGFGDLALNAEVWSQLEKDAGNDMKDKDWNSDGQLISYTKSNAELEAVIWDANMQYDFLKVPLLEEIEEMALTGEEVLTLGVLAGYRYERFGYNMYDLEYPAYQITILPDTRVLGYKIKYKLPYAGLAAEISNKNFGLDLNFKYSFGARAEDVDYHFLRNLTFYGDYDRNRQTFLGSISGFWNMTEDFRFRFGADGTYAKIDGTTWDETHNPLWDQVQETKLKQWIFWFGLNHRF